MKLIRNGAALAALMALSQPQIAIAQDCVQEADVADAAIYAMPAIVSAVEKKCAGKLASNGYLATKGGALKSRYSALAAKAWPGASRLITVFASSGNAQNGQEMAALISSMPEASVRPFLNSVIEQKLGEKIPVKECRNIERGMSLFEPLPPQNMGSLLAFIMRMANVDKPKICAASSK